MKQFLEISIRVVMAGKRISVLEDKPIETIQSDNQHRLFNMKNRKKEQ
jgi:hypothetical protein